MITWQKCIVASWILFLLYWGISATWVKRAAERQNWEKGLAYRLPTLLGYLLIFWPTPPQPLDTQLIRQTTSSGWLGAGLCMLGLLMAIWARTTLGRNWSSEVLFKQEHELVQHGPYRFVRHPIYTSILTMCLGSAIPAGRVCSFLGLLVLVGGFWIKLRQEEALLRRHFPGYEDYKNRVRALIPFVL